VRSGTAAPPAASKPNIVFVDRNNRPIDVGSDPAHVPAAPEASVLIRGDALVEGFAR